MDIKTSPESRFVTGFSILGGIPRGHTRGQLAGRFNGIISGEASGTIIAVGGAGAQCTVHITYILPYWFDPTCHDFYKKGVIEIKRKNGLHQRKIRSINYYFRMGICQNQSTSIIKHRSLLAVSCL
jgi:hypothetical protein